MASQSTQVDSISEHHESVVEDEVRSENSNNGNVSGDVSIVSFSAEAKTSGDEKVKEMNESHIEDAKELTPEEIEQRKKTVIDKCVEKFKSLKKTSMREADNEDAPYSDEFRKAILYIAKIFFAFKESEVPYHVILEHRQTIGKALVEHEVVNLLCDALSTALIRDDYSDSNGKMINSKWYPVKNTILTLLNYSDCNDKVKQTIAEHSQAIPLVLKFLNEKLPDYLEKKLNQNFEKMCKWLLSILHNCGALKENVTKLRELNVIKTVLPYLDSDIETHRLSVIAILADLVNEEEAELLGAHVSVFKFLLNTLEKALAVESHKSLGWSAEELTRAVRQLARNDANKEILVHEGCLPLLVSMLDIGKEVELNEAAGCLWALSFNDDNKKRMVDEANLVDRVYKGYKTAVSASLKQAFHGVLWSLRDVLVESEHFKTIGKKIKSLESTSSTPPETAQVEMFRSKGVSKHPEGHVMISYQWSSQEVIKRICNELRSNGVQVWIDIDYMKGSTLQAMAKAVEDASVVIIAMSQQYKDSPNTRAEAEYAFQRRKKIIPLIMQRSYKPDGWLGLILGSKLYYDFSGKYPDFNKPMKELLKAVQGSMHSDNVDSEPLLKSTQMPSLEAKPHHNTQTPMKATEQLKSWTKSDVTKWLTKHQLQMSELQNLGPEEIIFLYNLKHEAAEFFYYCLETKLKLVSLQDLARAAQAFQDLTL